MAEARPLTPHTLSVRAARTLSHATLTVPQMIGQLERAGFQVDAVLGDYRGRPWDDRADVWIILATLRGNP